jgi:hypothetical protein
MEVLTRDGIRASAALNSEVAIPCLTAATRALCSGLAAGGRWIRTIGTPREKPVETYRDARAAMALIREAVRPLAPIRERRVA